MANQIETTELETLESGQYGRSETIQMVNWRHPRFGEFRVEVTGFRLAETSLFGSNTWTQVLVNELGGTVTLDAYGNPKPGVKMFQAIGSGKLVDCTDADPESFVIPVRRDASGAPSTREKDGDNFNLDFFEAATGYLAVSQVSLVKRGEGFWMCFQELYRGRVIKVSAEEAEQLGESQYASVNGEVATIVPVHTEYAHRFANPWTMFPECRQLVEYALKNKACQPANKNHRRPIWAPKFPADIKNPQDLPKPDKSKYRFADRGRWDAGVVAWYNLVLGYGIIILRDGTMLRNNNLKRCFVHFRNIETAEGEMPILHPMQQVILRHREVEDRGRQATYVRAA